MAASVVAQQWGGEEDSHTLVDGLDGTATAKLHANLVVVIGHVSVCIRGEGLHTQIWGASLATSRR